MAKLPPRTNFSRSGLVVLPCIAVIALITYLDLVTGPEIGVSLFYLFPVAFAAWFGDRLSGPLVAFLSAGAWYFGEVNTGPTYSTVWAPSWNSFTRLVFFLTASILVRQFRTKRALVEELAVGERKYRSVFENAAVGVARLARDGSWLDTNERLCEQLGYSRDELQKLTYRDVVHPADRDSTAQLEGFGSSDFEGGELDQRWLRKDGTAIHVHLSLSPVRDEGGDLLYLVAVVEDISARKEAEAALHNLNLELENRVEERTRELLDLNQELESFNFSIAHDLRTPLRGIDGYSHLLLEEYGDRLDEPARRYLRRVTENTANMGELIDALLTLSQLGRGELRPGPVDLSLIAHEVGRELMERHPDRRIAFEVPPDLFAWGDKALLRTLLTNLIENAWKFTRGVERARVSVGRDETGHAFFVRDNGVGFDPAYSRKLFEPFQRLHSPGEFEGQGVGLATVARIVKRHGGRVWAEGAVGSGATIYFTLGQRIESNPVPPESQAEPASRVRAGKAAQDRGA